MTAQAWRAVMVAAAVALAACPDSSTPLDADGTRTEAGGKDLGRHEGSVPDRGPGDTGDTHDVITDLGGDDGSAVGSPWVVFGGSIEASVSSTGIFVDSAGKTHLAGSYWGGPIKLGTTVLPGMTKSVPLVAKLDPAGKVLWAKPLTKGITDCVPYGIHVDGPGNIYLAGGFFGSPTFGAKTLIDAGKGDGWVAKLTSSGNLLWVVSFGGTETERATSITVDSKGDVYIIGSFAYGGMFTIGNKVLTSSGKHDIFVAKLSAAGKVLWAVSAGGAELDFGYEIALDGAGGLRITAYIDGAASFGAIKVAPKTAWTTCVARLDSAGKFLWVAHGGSDQSINVKGLDVDGAGNSYITGRFKTQATFGSSTLLASASYDSYVAKVSPSGAFAWAIAGGQGSKGSWRSGDISVASSGVSYLTGDFKGQPSFGATTLTALGRDDIFVARLDAGGKWTGAVPAGGKLGDGGERLDVDGAGNVHAAGSVLYDAFDPNAVSTDTLTFGKSKYTIKGKPHLFVWKVPASAL